MPLVNPQKMFEAAQKKNTAICAFNFVNLEIMRAILKAAQAKNTPVILQTSEGAIKYYGLENIVSAAKSLSKEFSVDFALHLDHGTTVESCKACVDAGYTSVMIDASHYDFEKNADLTKQVADYAGKKGVFVEAELGKLAGIEDNISNAESLFTDPKDVCKFLKLTGINSLAVSVGTSHGAYKLPTPGGLKIDIIKEIRKQNPNLPLVLHGASTVDKNVVDAINALGGQIKKAHGTCPDELKKAIVAGISKVNVDTDLRLAYTYGLRKFFNENPSEVDIRKINAAALKEVEKTTGEKIDMICG